MTPASRPDMRLAWYFDFISPYSYLQFAAHPGLFADLIELHGLAFKPVVFAGLLAHWGQKGPVEIPEKRRQTYRMIAWDARERGIPLRFPPGHPFNPVPALRLALALGNARPQRPMPDVVRAIFDFIWKEGHSIGADWALLCRRFDLGVAEADALIGAQAVKDALRANGDEAIALGIYGVPTFAASVEGAPAGEGAPSGRGAPSARGPQRHLFWGEDATGLFRAYLADPALFDSVTMRALDALPVAAARKGA